MSNHKKAMGFLYAGILMALIAADWHWYAGKFPDESFVLKLPYIELIYILYLIVMTGCFIGAGIFFWKDRPKKIGRKKQGKRQGERR